jgi:hypothetical protein
VELEVCAFDMKVIEIVNTYFMCVSWIFLFEIFNKREGWNLIACNVACSVVYQWMEREKVSPKSIIWNSWIDEFAQQGLQREFIYALKWLLVMKGNYGFQVCKHYDSYALLELKGFNYKNLTAEDETVVIRIDGVSDDSHAP